MENTVFPEMPFECVQLPLPVTKIQMQSQTAEEQPPGRVERIPMKSPDAEGGLALAQAAVEEDKLQSARQLKNETRTVCM